MFEGKREYPFYTNLIFLNSKLVGFSGGRNERDPNIDQRTRTNEERQIHRERAKLE